MIVEVFWDLLLEFQKMQLSFKATLSTRNSYKKNIKKGNSSVPWVVTRVLSLHMPPRPQRRIRRIRHQLRLYSPSALALHTISISSRCQPRLYSPSASASFTTSLGSTPTLSLLGAADKSRLTSLNCNFVSQSPCGLIFIQPLHSLLLQENTSSLSH